MPRRTVPIESAAETSSAASVNDEMPAEPVKTLETPTDAKQTVEAETIEAETEAPAPETTQTEADEPPAAASEAPRRRWFRRRSRKSTDAPAVEDPVVETPTEAVPEELTEPTPGTTEATEPAVLSEPIGSEEASAEAGEEEASAQAAEEKPVAQRKPITRPVAVAVAVAAALFVAAAAFGGAMLQPYLADRALVNTKLHIARTAANAITTLWTYTPDDMDKLPDRSAKYLAGDFEDQYRKYVDAIAPTNKQAKVSNSTQVMGTAVESLNGSQASAVVYTNTSYTSPQTNNIPSLRYLSYRLNMQRYGSQWLINKMTTITSLDLSPKLG